MIVAAQRRNQSRKPLRINELKHLIGIILGFFWIALAIRLSEGCDGLVASASSSVSF